MDDAFAYLRELDFLSTVIGGMVFAFMFGGSSKLQNADTWMGGFLTILGVALTVSVVYAKYIVETEYDVSELLQSLAGVQREYLVAGFVGGAAVGWLLGAARAGGRKKAS